MATGLGTTSLKNSKEMEYLLSLLIARPELSPGDYISSEPSHVLAYLHLGLACLQRISQWLEHLLSAFHHMPRIPLFSPPTICDHSQPPNQTPQKTYRTLNQYLYYTLSLSPMNAGATMWRWWYHSSPFAISSPLPMKCFDPCRCCHDLPDTALYFARNSLIISVSVRHSLGSIPFQNKNLFPEIKIQNQRIKSKSKSGSES